MANIIGGFAFSKPASDNTQPDPSQVLGALFSESYTEEDAKKMRAAKWWDHREKECVELAETATHIILFHYDSAEKFFNKNVLFLKKLYQDLGQPEEMLAFMLYDNAETHGFSLIRNGEAVRMYLSDPENIMQWGNAVPEEGAWSKITAESGPDAAEDDEPQPVMFVNTQTGREVSENELGSVLAQNVLKAKLNSTAEMLGKLPRRYFKLAVQALSKK